ncbi:MAG TPA: hypothetical protein PKH70_05070 [Syntrophorhabdaceae bacterium]|nr:hypothetical protein [Syntrophorhabdaceae bacterium]
MKRVLWWISFLDLKKRRKTEGWRVGGLAEDRSQKTEDRSQKSEVRRQKLEDRRLEG